MVDPKKECPLDEQTSVTTAARCKNLAGIRQFENPQ
jgi:hypothetical protein